MHGYPSEKIHADLKRRSTAGTGFVDHEENHVVVGSNGVVVSIRTSPRTIAPIVLRWVALAH